MLMDILMEALMSMDDESLDYVLESCDAEELEIISDAMERTEFDDMGNPIPTKEPCSSRSPSTRGLFLTRVGANEYDRRHTPSDAERSALKTVAEHKLAKRKDREEHKAGKIQGKGKHLGEFIDNHTSDINPKWADDPDYKNAVYKNKIRNAREITRHGDPDKYSDAESTALKMRSKKRAAEREEAYRRWDEAQREAINRRINKERESRWTEAQKEATKRRVDEEIRRMQ